MKKKTLLWTAVAAVSAVIVVMGIWYHSKSDKGHLIVTVCKKTASCKVSGATVKVMQNTTERASATTNADGEAPFDLEPGTYTIMAEKANCTLDKSKNTKITDGGHTTETLKFKNDPTCSCT